MCNFTLSCAISCIYIHDDTGKTDVQWVKNKAWTSRRVQVVLTLAHSIGVIQGVAWSLKVSLDVAVAISEGRRFHSLTVGPN